MFEIYEQKKIQALRIKIENVYKTTDKFIPFHGWHHIVFVTSKSLQFAKSINADLFLVESSALVHDLNYLLEKNSSPEIASGFREKILLGVGYTAAQIKKIERIITDSHLANRAKKKIKLSDESKCLSDADTLFKSLPVTPIFFAQKYIKENNISIKDLADKIISEQDILMKDGLYFYTKMAKEKYMNWAKTNIDLWRNIDQSLKDEDVANFLSLAGIKAE